MAGFGRSQGIISLFARHPVAANLLMLAMMLVGLWSLTRLNTQFLPTFAVNYISIDVEWVVANAEDVETSITVPLEQELRTVDYLKKMTSSSRLGGATIRLEFFQDTDMNRALEQVKEKVSAVRNLPPDAETPLIVKEENFETIARVLVTGEQQLAELRHLVYRMERELLDAGIAKVEIEGLPEEMIAIQVPIAKLLDLQLSLADVATRVALRSQDVPAGTIGRGNSGQQLRSLEQRRSVESFLQLPIVNKPNERVLLEDIATIDRVPRDYEVLVNYAGHSAVELTLYRTATADALGSAKILEKWLAKAQTELPAGVQLHVYDESWKLIDQRIFLLLKNGAGGLVLILLLLFLFLNWRVAFWVAMGIPASFLAAMAVLYLFGGSINMVSLFAMIMTLGIIVDDTIVVGEEALTQLHQGHPVLEAVEIGAKKMLVPILASSLTTMCAFLPLFLVGDVIGTILSAIPLVVICIILASIIECFLVLPGHLYHSFRRLKALHSSPLRNKIDGKFEYFREHLFRRFVHAAIRYRWATLSIALGLVLLTVGLLQSGRLNFTFFPTPDSTMIQANIRFHAGTPPSKMDAFLQTMVAALQHVDEQNREGDQALVLTTATFMYKGAFEQGYGAQLASVVVELIGPDQREITNKEVIKAWRDAITVAPSVASLVIASPRAGPPGQDIDIQLYGQDAPRLKQAALALNYALQGYPGVSDIDDDLPFGQEQVIYTLTPEGKALGLTIDEVGRQLRAAFTGFLVQIFYQGNDEVEVRVMLPDEERYSLTTLERIPVITPDKKTVPLKSVMDVRFQRGFDVLRHTDTRLAVHVQAEVDPQVTNTNKVLADLQREVLPQLAADYDINYRFEGKAEEQADTLDDMTYGMLLALVMIYIILAWVFASYGWPLLVMTAIPLGLVGAILGHYWLGYDLTILSLFGLFGLSGIVINDSIILLTTYKQLRESATNPHQAIVDASCLRLRAVLLTSLTTIAGLTPLLFETSLQAQFLIPMAISIVFGLAFATLLILVIVPTLLSVYEDVVAAFQKRAGGD